MHLKVPVGTESLFLGFFGRMYILSRHHFFNGRTHISNVRNHNPNTEHHLPTTRSSMETSTICGWQDGMGWDGMGGSTVAVERAHLHVSRSLGFRILCIDIQPIAHQPLDVGISTSSGDGEIGVDLHAHMPPHL